MNNYLKHHGIKGQKWGVRNGPPYPLKESQKSRSEKKVEKTLNTPIGSAASDLAILTATTSLSALASALLTKGLYRLTVASERKRNTANNTKPIKQIKHPHSEEQDQTMVNKAGFDSGKPEYRMNCTMCTTSYDLRRRGYDVKANVSRCGRDLKAWYKDTSKKDFTVIRNYDTFKETIKNEPEGARGNICTGVGDFDSAHSMVWEKKDGHIVIRDCQDGKFYPSIDESPIRSKTRHKYSYIRTDNREINWDTVRDATVPREG